MFSPCRYHNCSNKRNFLLKANTVEGSVTFSPARDLYRSRVYIYRKYAHVPHREYRSHTRPISLSIYIIPPVIQSSFQLHATRDIALKDILLSRKTSPLEFFYFLFRNDKKIGQKHKFSN